MSEIQERQNQRIIGFAEANFSKSTHEYGRHDLAGRSANSRGEKIDPSRFNEDKDHDGRKGVDCSSLVYYSLHGAGFNLKKSAGEFTTHTLFQGNKLTGYAKENFDVLPSSAKTDGSLKPGDLLMMTMPNGAQHIAIFKEYDEKDRIHFFGSQTSTGPAEVVMTGNSYWDNKTIFHGALRAKENFIKPEMKPQVEETKQQSKFEELSAMLKGLVSDTDGSYARKVLADNSDEVARFNQIANERIEQEKVQELAVQENKNEQQRGFSRSL